MPNLKQIYGLKAEYSTLSRMDKDALNFIEKKEAGDTLRKAFDIQMLNENRSGLREETRLYAFLSESLHLQTPALINFFESGREEEVALLYIDITSFSKTIQGWNSGQIKDYLDDYYERVIPIIYKNGGEIDKLMGDGIVCLFGEPFLSSPTQFYNVYKAEECAEAVIKEFYRTDKNVKVAIHIGKVRYYKVPGEHYGEYTMIGQPVTDIYRLESISHNNAVNFYAQSLYDRLGWVHSIYEVADVTGHNFDIDPKLQGVDFTQMRTIQFPGYY